ncbi:MAG: hypothetical protein FWF76_02755 [Oscillospiraceae bacterium]|nr:hypothetical protein [Oscillospiraceae bacterium]
MNKIFILILSMVLFFALTACSDTDESTEEGTIAQNTNDDDGTDFYYYGGEITIFVGEGFTFEIADGWSMCEENQFDSIIREIIAPDGISSVSVISESITRVGFYEYVSATIEGLESFGVNEIISEEAVVAGNRANFISYNMETLYFHQYIIEGKNDMVFILTYTQVGVESFLDGFIKMVESFTFV